MNSCTIGNPGAVVEWDGNPFKCDDYYTPSADTSIVRVVVKLTDKLVSAMFSPLDRCDLVDVGKMITELNYIQAVYSPSRYSDTMKVCFTAGYVGHDTSAFIDVLDNCTWIDVGKVVWSAMNPGVVHNGIDVYFNGNRVYFYRG